MISKFTIKWGLRRLGWEWQEGVMPGKSLSCSEMRWGELPFLPRVAGWMETPSGICPYWETCSFLVCVLPIHAICRFLADEIIAQNGVGTNVHKVPLTSLERNAPKTALTSQLFWSCYFEITLKCSLCTYLQSNDFPI